MKYKAGDKVRIKSLDWYKEQDGLIPSWLCPCCGRVMTITVAYIQGYAVKEVQGVLFKGFMIEGLVEEENEKKLSDESWRYKNMFCPSQYPQSYECPEGYVFKDENGNVINAKKIVLEKKKKEYPKTYCECKDILGLWDIDDTERGFYKTDLIDKLQILLICRDAYWKIASREMGLNRPWEPDWKNDEQFKYIIICRRGCIIKDTYTAKDVILSFPTAEMRDAFKENFKELIEECKELL